MFEVPSVIEAMRIVPVICRAGDGAGVLALADRGDVGRAHARGLQGRVVQARDREVVGPSPDLGRGRIEVRDTARRSRRAWRADVAAAIAVRPPEGVEVVDRGRARATTGRSRC